MIVGEGEDCCVFSLPVFSCRSGPFPLWCLARPRSQWEWPEVEEVYQQPRGRTLMAGGELNKYGRVSRWFFLGSFKYLCGKYKHMVFSYFCCCTREVSRIEKIFYMGLHPRQVHKNIFLSHPSRCQCQYFFGCGLNEFFCPEILGLSESYHLAPT